MGYLQSIRDEYDEHGNYIGNSDEGNRFHGVKPATREAVTACAKCGSTIRRDHGGGGTVCGNCDCAEAVRKYR